MVNNSAVEASAAEQLASQEPQTASEKYMASLWLELIGLDRIKLSDKFLDLGGNSLTLNIILSRINAEKEASMKPQWFFDENNSSLLDLSKKLDMLLGEKTG